MGLLRKSNKHHVSRRPVPEATRSVLWSDATDVIQFPEAENPLMTSSVEDGRQSWAFLTMTNGFFLSVLHKARELNTAEVALKDYVAIDNQAKE